MSRSFDLPSADAVTIGTVGEPGSRVFLLQARLGPEKVTLKIEKGHAAALAEAVGEILKDLPPQTPVDDPGLQKPFEPDWAVGSMAFAAFDEATGHVTLIAQELALEDDADTATAAIGLSPAQLAMLATRALELVAGGRPTCELCGFPIDPTGHSCPKTNGHLTR